jgi:hypothetical protein
MSTAIEEIWAILREVAQSQKETAHRFQETERMSQETERKFQETDRKFQETDRQFKATDHKLKQESEKLSKALGRLGNRLGDFIEDAVRPSAVRLFQERGIAVHEVHQNIEAQRGEEGIEVDLMVVNDAEVVAIECKSNLTQDDVREHLERLGKLKRLLPAYRDKRVLGAVAAMVIPDNIATFAYRQGLFVIGQSGEHLRIRNDPEFTPKAW